MYYNGPNRYICSVLEEMRDKLKVLDADNLQIYKSIAIMQIEEVQTLANVMESALSDAKDLRKLKVERRKLKLQVGKLQAKVDILKEKLGDEKDPEHSKKSSFERLMEDLDD